MPGASLRNWPKPAPPPQPSVDGEIDRIMRQAAAQPPTEGNTPVRSDATADIHGPRDIASRIASLQREGVEQITDPATVKAMRPEQIVAAQREGRLLTYMSGITAADDEG